MMKKYVVLFFWVLLSISIYAQQVKSLSPLPVSFFFSSLLVSTLPTDKNFMNKNDIENKSLILIILLGYIFNLLLGWMGSLYIHGSSKQMLLFQIGTAFAISASVMAARYTGLRGQHVAASAYILLGITHGISLAALSKAGVNPDREATMAIPMIPALIFMFWCSLYPTWLRVLGIVPCILFALVYVNVHSGDSYLGWTLYLGYAALQIIEVIWGIYLFMDWKKIAAQKQHQ